MLFMPQLVTRGLVLLCALEKTKTLTVHEVPASYPKDGSKSEKTDYGMKLAQVIVNDVWVGLAIQTNHLFVKIIYFRFQHVPYIHTHIDWTVGHIHS